MSERTLGEEANIQTTQHLGFRIRACLRGEADPFEINAFGALDTIIARALDTTPPSTRTIPTEDALRSRTTEAIADSQHDPC